MVVVVGKIVLGVDIAILGVDIIVLGVNIAILGVDVRILGVDVIIFIRRGNIVVTRQGEEAGGGRKTLGG